jgi:hypothetical protein
MDQYVCERDRQKGAVHAATRTRHRARAAGRGCSPSGFHGYRVPRPRLEAECLMC